MTKKKIIKLFAILAAVFLGSLEMDGAFLTWWSAAKGEQKRKKETV